MKYLLFLGLVISLVGCVSTDPVAENASDPVGNVDNSKVGNKVSILVAENVNDNAGHSAGESAVVLGQISAQKLLAQQPLFQASYDSFIVTPEQIATLQSIDRKLRLVILFGSWCHDSQREVPRLLKLLDAADNKNIAVSLIGIGLGKAEPKAVVAQYELAFTPTVIVFDGAREIGRIIESPKQNWAADLHGLSVQ